MADSHRISDEIAREHARGYDDDVYYLDNAWMVLMLVGVVLLITLFAWGGS